MNPIFKSPMVDNGYDISDFRDIDPVFGTLDDFKELVKKMKSLDIKLLLDMVPNHSSDQHVWFNLSLHRVDPYTDYYVWNDGKIDPETQQRVPPNNWANVFNGSAWEWREERQQYYLHQFTKKQIDFDLRNPLVVKEMDDIMTYWIDLGVDGFRMDAIIFLVEGDFSKDEPHAPGQTWLTYDHPLTLCQPEDYELQNHWDQLVFNYSLRDGKERAIFIEAYTSDENTLKLYGHGNTSFAVPFNFHLLVNGSEALRAPQLRDLVQNFLSELSEDETPNWVIGNHDTMRMANLYGPEAVDAISMLIGVLPGVKVVYNGEEIGMRDTFIRWDQTVDPAAHALGPNHFREFDRDIFRTPMQWDASSPSAGFSTSNKTWLPVNPNYWWLNVEAENNAETSHLKVFQDISKVRKDPVLQRGNTTILAPNNDTLAVVRTYNESFYVYIFNIGSETLDITTQNFFSPLSLDSSMSVEVVSINCKVTKGTILQKGLAQVSLRPKAAMILKSPPSVSSTSANSPLIALILLTLRSVIHLIT